MLWSSILVQAFAAALLIAFHAWVNVRQPEPYMDELFHVPQSQEFCNAIRSGRLPSYDSSITTLPGLYLPPTLVCLLSNATFTSATRGLRLSSLLFSLATLPLLSSILAQLRVRNGLSAHSGDLINLFALALWLHPVQLFYANLFYTDAPATFYILLCWYFALSGRHFLSAWAGFAAAVTRQTHLVWHMYVAVDTALYEIPCWPRTLAQAVGIGVRLIKRIQSHVAAGVLYFTFLMVNGGPAVGDKGHHSVSMHYAMLPYFLGFHALAFLPFLIVSPAKLIAQIRALRHDGKNLALCLATCVGLSALVSVTGDSVHPFILADNRHYTFYMYRKWLLRSAWRRLCLVPLYAWGLVSPALGLRIRAEKVEQANSKKDRSVSVAGLQYFAEATGYLTLLFCAAMTLIPSPLMEPRYFVVGSLFLSMRMLCCWEGSSSAFGILLVCAFQVASNILFVYVFAERPFPRPVDPHMPHDLSPGRFMF